MDNLTRISIARLAVLNALHQRFAPQAKLADITVVGSTYIRDCETSDVDMLYHLQGVPLAGVFFEGWTYGGSTALSGDHWCSWTKEVDGVEVNMLLVDKREYFTRWLVSAEVCRFLHLAGVTLPSALVHGVHEIIMDDSNAVDEIARRWPKEAT